MNLVEIAKKISYLEIIGNKEINVNNISSIADFKNECNTLTWVNDLNIEKLTNFQNGIFICSKQIDNYIKNKNCTYIISSNPRKTFREVLLLFSKEMFQNNKQSTNYIIEENVQLGKNVKIGNNVVIEQNCKIGNDVVIGHNTVILRNTVIENNVVIGSNNTIGGVGFGYELNENNTYELLPHIGNVILEEGVEIGNNTCIDRGVVGSTILKRNVKVDNLVHIAHGVIVGENSLLIANSMIGGSVNIGENCWIAPSSSIKNKISIKNNVLIGMGAVVLKNVEENTVIIGNPGKELRK